MKPPWLGSSSSSHIDTPYYPVYKSLAKRRAEGEVVLPSEYFHIVLPLDQICSANIFDDNTFEDYFDRQRQA